MVRLTTERATMTASKRGIKEHNTWGTVSSDMAVRVKLAQAVHASAQEWWRIKREFEDAVAGKGIDYVFALGMDLLSAHRTTWQGEDGGYEIPWADILFAIRETRTKTHGYTGALRRINSSIYVSPSTTRGTL